MSKPAIYDTTTPLLLLKVGHYPMHHGGLGLARSLGSVHVPVAAMVERRLTPLALSRYVKWRFPALSPQMSTDELLSRLADIVNTVDARPVAAATDDEAAVFLNELGGAADEFVVRPKAIAGQARLLSDKWGLAQECQRLGVPTPALCVPKSREDLMDWAATAHLPLVLKNQQSFARISAPAVGATTVLKTRGELEQWAKQADWESPVIVQEYVPAADREDFIYQAYRSTNSDQILSFTGRKHRDWPVGRGETTLAESLPAPRLRAQFDSMLAQLDYRGVCDLDVIWDRRDDQYKVIDFNPRFGANGATFVTDVNVNLVRAYHLDLTGRAIPEGRQVDGVVFQVESRDRWARRDGAAPGPRPTVRAYRSVRDPLPAILSATHGGLSAVRGRLR